MVGTDAAYAPFESQNEKGEIVGFDIDVVSAVAQKAGIQGEIDVLLDIDEKGKVVSVKIVKGLGFGTDDACVASWRKSQWKPAMQDTTAVPVTGVPNKCTVTAVQ